MAPVFGVTAMGVSIVAVPLVSIVTRKFAYDRAHIDNVFAAEE
jgi:hypothetical protein